VRNIKTGIADGGMTRWRESTPRGCGNHTFDKLQIGSKLVVAKQTPSANPLKALPRESIQALHPASVATALLMAAILLVGIVAYTQLPVSACQR